MTIHRYPRQAVASGMGLTSVFQLEVTMANALSMAVANTRDKLLKEKSGLIFREPARLDDPVKKLATSCILHDNAKM